MTEIREDRLSSAKQSKAMENNIDELKEDQIQIKQQLNTLEKKSGEDNVFTATVSEDLDAIDNEKHGHCQETEDVEESLARQS